MCRYGCSSLVGDPTNQDVSVKRRGKLGEPSLGEWVQWPQFSPGLKSMLPPTLNNYACGGEGAGSLEFLTQSSIYK